MDSDKNEATGLLFAEEIRKSNFNAYIIFLTAFDSYIKTAVNSNIEPLAYISKMDNDIELKLEQAFNQIFYNSHHQMNEEKLSVIDDYNDNLYIPINDIYMIKSYPLKQKYVEIITGYERIIARGRLSDFTNITPNLIKCHKSMIVNKSKIYKITKGTTPKSRIILFDNKLNFDFPECILSDKNKKNLI